jgi:DNA-binding NarL/FixJ family response regulator
VPVSDGDARVRVMIVEDEGLYRDLLRIVLSQHDRLEVVGAYADGESALAAATKIRPQVAILDIELRSALNGIQLGLELRKKLPNVGIVLLSNHGDPQFVSSLPQETISGWSYLLKKSVSDVQALSRAIEGAAAGFVVLDSQLVAAMYPKAGGPLARLTPRQNDIIERIAQGYTNGAIAQQLVLSEKSIENQINQIYQQLQIERETNSVHPRVKAVLIYLQESQFRGGTANLRVK